VRPDLLLNCDHMRSPAQRRSSTDGFTLIEILVVVLIIAILVAVSAPSFAGQATKAHNSVAAQSLALAYKAVQSVSAGDGKYPYVDGTLAGANQLAQAIADSGTAPFHSVVGGDRTPTINTVSPSPTDVVVDATSTPTYLVLFNTSEAPNGPSVRVRECTLVANGFNAAPSITCVIRTP